MNEKQSPLVEYWQKELPWMPEWVIRQFLTWPAVSYCLDCECFDLLPNHHGHTMIHSLEDARRMMLDDRFSKIILSRMTGREQS